MSLRICMFSNLFPPINSGSSTFTWNLARKLAARGHHVSVVAAQVEDASAYEEKDGLTIYRLAAVRLPRLKIAHGFNWMTYTFRPNNLKMLNEIFARENFDIVHQQNHVFDTILSSPRLARRYRLPLILTIHTWAQHTNPLLNLGLIFLDGVARRVILKKSDRIISPDPVVQKYVESRHGLADSPVIPYGIEVSNPSPDRVEELRRKYGLGEGPVILSLGHVNALRDRLDLIEAMPTVLQKFPKSKLLIVGEVCVPEPMNLVKKLGLEDKVIFTGAVPHDSVPCFFALSALETHTFNGNYPGPGIASMEAMAAGLPVVTVEIDSKYDFSHFRNWENVVMIPAKKPEVMADALLRLLADDSLRERIGRNAKEIMANRYSWDAVCDAYVKVYHQAIERKQEAWAKVRAQPDSTGKRGSAADWRL